MSAQRYHRSSSSRAGRRRARTACPAGAAAARGGGDHAGLAHVWVALGYGVANSRGRMEDWAHAAEQALRHARARRSAQRGRFRPRGRARPRAAARRRGAAHARRTTARDPASPRRCYARARSSPCSATSTRRAGSPRRSRAHVVSLGAATTGSSARSADIEASAGDSGRCRAPPAALRPSRGHGPASLPFNLGAAPQPLALRARPTRRGRDACATGRELGATEPTSALASGAGSRARPPRRARGGDSLAREAVELTERRTRSRGRASLSRPGRGSRRRRPHRRGSARRSSKPLERFERKQNLAMAGQAQRGWRRCARR